MRRLLLALCAWLFAASNALAAIGTPVTQATTAWASTIDPQTFTNANAIAAGDFIVIAVATQSSRTVSSITGGSISCTIRSETRHSGKVLTLAYCAPPGGGIAAGTTFTVDLSGTSQGAVVMQSVSGVSTIDLFPASTTSNFGTSTAPAWTDPTTYAQADEILFGATFVVDGESDTLTKDTNFNNVATATRGTIGRVHLSSRVVSSTTAVTRTESNSASRQWITLGLTAKDAGGGGGPPAAMAANCLLMDVC